MSFNTKTYDSGNNNYNTNFDTFIDGNNNIALDGTKYYDSKFGKVMASFVVDNGDSILGGNAIISNALTVYDNMIIGGQISLLNTYTISFIRNKYNNTSCLNLSTSSTGKYVSFGGLYKIYSSVDFGKTMTLSSSSDSMSCIFMNSILFIFYFYFIFRKFICQKSMFHRFMFQKFMYRKFILMFIFLK